MLKKVLLVLLAIILLVSPLIIRWLYFYEGRYEPGKVARPDLTQIKEPLAEVQPFADRQAATAFGTVLVDLAHGNHVEMAELNILQARLAARGLRLEPVKESSDLAGKLRYAFALVIISPGQDWAPDEIQLVQEFVDKGGRLLLVTDPTRFEVIYDEWDLYVGLDYDAPHINDLAARFGLVFQADYLYNTVDNEGNYRNIKLTDLADNPLTQGLDQLVFYAAHSIISEEPALITAGGETRSSTSGRSDDLAVGVLVADGAVLALGDLTFMTEPYNSVYDNDRFVANIADFLGSAPRQFELADFPFFFGDQVDLVYAGSPLLGGALLEGGGTLQDLFAKHGKALTVRQEEDEAHDTLFFGLYEQAEEVEPYLAAAEVTLLITPTQTLEQEGAEATPRATTSPSLTQPLTTTLPLTPAVNVPATPTPTPEGSAESTTPSSDRNRVSIGALGEMALTGTSLLLLQTEGDRQIMVVLTDTESGLDNALKRLTDGDLAGCLLHEVERTVASLLALCPTGEGADGEEGGGWEKPTSKEPTPAPGPAASPTAEPPQPPSEPEGSILILALDAGKGRYDSKTSADDYATILEERYEITIWSLAQDGPADSQDLLDHDLVIWTTGDYEDALSDENGDLLFTLMLEGVPVILSGAFVGDTETEAVQRDIQVEDASHPLAAGFMPAQVIEFATPPSGEEYAVDVLEGFEEDASVVFVRGPESEASGIPSIVTIDDEFGQFRLVFIGFPLYLLPDESKSRLVLNAVSWLLRP